MSRQRNQNQNPHSPERPVQPGRSKQPLQIGIALLLLLAALLILRRGEKDSPTSTGFPNSTAGTLKPGSDAEVFGVYAGSTACKECHAEAFEKWARSHHALAERKIDPKLDRTAFNPDRNIRHGSQSSEAQMREGRFQLITTGPDGRTETFTAARVIGVDPLRQFLFPLPGGRWQAGELAFDPRAGEWFDVFGNEDRRAGEWGHWTGRGMTWNSMCAPCHNTRLHKNYNTATDSYATTMAELGVGCESCHGPLKAHADWQRARGGASKSDPTLRPLNKNQMLDTCGSCHARRGELTGEFAPGEKFSDHFTLVIPDETDLFHADGQVREEDYEFTSFLGSKMYAAGVRCGDCHDAHSGKRLVEGDALCLKCHAAPVPPAPTIDPLSHSHHKPGTPGGRCVDCHMPETTYMQRHARRDHGFTIPDPLLTKQHNIPNACNRCHADRDTGWAMEAVEKWHGPRMNRPTRARAQTIAEARAGATSAPTRLIESFSSEKIPLWRASAARLLHGWNNEPAATAALVKAAADPEPIVRANAAFALDGLGGSDNPAVQSALRTLLNDPSRSVRVTAAWTVRARLDTNTVAGQDLLLSLRHGLDEPAGLHQMGVWHFDRGESAAALKAFRRAVEWDGNSPPLRLSYAIALSTQGRAAEAVAQLEAACRLAPREANYRYQLGLALNEAGKLPEATAALKQAVQFDARLMPAWYNLGLAYSAAEQPERAIEALARAEALDPGNPRAPYARSTILARVGRRAEAIIAVRRALEIQPEFSEAAALLRALEEAR